MAGNLEYVSSTTITSAVSSVTLTGIDDDSVYMFTYTNMTSSTDSATGLYFRFTVGGSADDSSEYDYSDLDLRATETFGEDYAENQTVLSLAWATGNDTGEQDGGIFYIYNANSSSEWTFATYESYYMVSDPKLRGRQGGLAFTDTSAVDGVHLYWSHGNITSGTFALYKVV